MDDDVTFECTYCQNTISEVMFCDICNEPSCIECDKLTDCDLCHSICCEDCVCQIIRDGENLTACMKCEY